MIFLFALIDQTCLPLRTLVQKTPGGFLPLLWARRLNFTADWFKKWEAI